MQIWLFLSQLVGVVPVVSRSLIDRNVVSKHQEPPMMHAGGDQLMDRLRSRLDLGLTKPPLGILHADIAVQGCELKSRGTCQESRDLTFLLI